MTIQTEWFDWVDSGLDWDTAPFESPSPNLTVLSAHLRAVAGVQMGIEYDRPIRAGTKPSEHSWGAALDWRWKYHPDVAGWPHRRWLTRAEAVERIDWLIANSAELGICAIVDEGRSWRPPAWRDARRQTHVNGWVLYDSGYDGWIHIVTTYDSFGDATPITDRLTAPPPQEVPTMPPLAVVHDPVLLGNFALVEGRWVCWPAELAALFPDVPKVSIDHEFLREQMLDDQGPDGSDLWKARAANS